MNTKYIIAIISVLVIGGGALLLTNTKQAPAPEEQIATENPIGEGAQSLGALSENQSGATTTPSEEVGITPAMIAAHNTQADCWVGYKGVAYDLSEFLPRHPGSAAAIAPYCGTVEEFTAALNRKHGTSKDGSIGKVGTVEGNLNQ